jgi:hypothetical protein
MMLSRIALFILIVLCNPATKLSADQGTQAEIDHLLAFIKESDCTFIRNGKTHTALKAFEHISKKYEYIKKRIDSTEDFIKYGASQSSITKSEYQIECGTISTSSNAWLNSELERYRNNKQPVLQTIEATQNN